MIYLTPMSVRLPIYGLLLLLLLPGVAQALSSDSEQPMEVLADSAELDDKKKVAIYRGNVEVNQGTMFISGHTLTVYYDENQELDHAVMEGDRAYYKQLPDDSKVYDEAWAERMEYYPNDGIIILIDDAKVVQKDVTLTGQRINYDTVNSHVIAKSSPDDTQPDDADQGEDGRVRVIISPKKSSDDSE